VWNCGRENKPLPCFRPRYVERHWIPDGLGGAREVPHGQGLLVWTLACEDFPAGCALPLGTFWYAVTTVDEFGLENPLVGSGNRAAVLEGIADPLPIEVPRAFLDCSSPEYCPHENDGDENPLPLGVHVFIQYMDLRSFNATFAAPNPLNCWWGEDPGVLRVREARQYAFTYTVAEPDPLLAGCAPPYPLVVDLHSHGGTAKAQLYGKGGNAAYAEGCALLLQPLDVGETWWYGFSASFDYRDAQEGCPQEPCAEIDAEFPPLAPYERVPDTGPIANFTEARVLRMVYDLLRAPLPGYAVDPDRVYVQGSSMGGSGALAFALRYPQVFAAAAAGKPMTDFEAFLSGVAPHPQKDLRHELPLRWGADPVLAAESGLPLLPVANFGPAGWADHLAAFDGLPVYSWMDHPSQVASPAWAAMDNAPLGIEVGFSDDVLPYPTQGLPFFEATGFGDQGRAWGGVIGCEGHGGSAFDGMPPSLAASATNPSPAPFSDYRIERDETVPGFSGLTGGHYPPPPVACCDAPCLPEGPFDYYQDLIWCSTWYDWDGEYGPPVDLPLRWEISLKWTGSFAPPPTVTITPRRLQQFLVEPDAHYAWWNVELTTSALIQPPTSVQALPSGLIELPNVVLTPPGNRLTLVRLP
jgi:pimeloyl-ACP methyl ester carboxylesterase